MTCIAPVTLPRNGGYMRAGLTVGRWAMITG
jgi:hypothetical protein